MGSLSNRNSPQLIQQLLSNNLSKNNIKMRSLSLSSAYDQPLLTIDPADNFISYNGSSHNSVHPKLIDCNERTKKPSYQKDGNCNQNGNFGGMTPPPPPSKPRVPDILMINKYYGLVPQKFAISSRTKQASVSSTPSSATSRRATKTTPNPARPRAKSSSLQHHHQRQEERKMKEGKGHISENDSPEPIKMVLVSRRGSIGSESRENDSTDPFGPVTKRMSVEKSKKWRNNGGAHKGINLNMEGSIGQTLSLLENGLKSHARKNGSNMASTDYLNNRRVIKIDLNSISCDEENYEVPPSPERTTTREKEEKPSEESDVSSSIFNGENNNGRCRRQDSSSSMGSLSSFDDNGCFTYWINNDDKSGSPLVNEMQTEQSGFPDKDEHFPGKRGIDQMDVTHEKMGVKQTSSTETVLESIIANASDKLDGLSSQNAKFDASLENKESKRKPDSGIDSSVESIPKVLHDQKVATMKGCGKLSQRTISFDEKFLESGNGGLDGADTKRRPTTAIARCATKTFTLPNGFNPPSKVIPWTQQKSSGGKPLTLAERRAKFQRVPSVHSSSSLSNEAGEEEGLSEELDSNASNNCIRPPSSAFKDTRKPLYVMQPPEVPTMISQINPNADEDIQIEIEKVAIMLRKMQFSRSLDSGIEAEMHSKSNSLPESPNAKSVQNADKTKLEENAEISSQNENTSASVSSVSSMDSNSSEDQSQICNKLKPTFPPESTASRLTGHDRKRGDTTPARDGSIDRSTNRGSPVTNSTSSSNNSTLRKNSTSSSSSQVENPSSSTTTKTTVQRPPLRKAVSISCEQELLKPGGGYRQNEVNSSASDHTKSGRPKTAVDKAASTSTTTQKGYGAGTRSTHNNNYGHRQSSVSSSESCHADSPAGSQGSRNRKILIKKALMEINQSSVNLRRKWGTLGRPRTAPSSEKNVSHQGTMSQHQHPVNAQQRRKPLKASPITITGDGKTGFISSRKTSSTGVGASCGEMERGNLEKSSSVGGPSQYRANSESREEPGDNPEQRESRDCPSNSYTARGRSAFRQSFSLDESALLGFSIKSVNEGRMPIFERLEESSAASESGSMSILNDEVSFLSSKKREQCLKVYEKMMKTGCGIKLDTIFRGMLTPSEYRAFMKAAEKATIEAEEKAREDGELALEETQSDEQVKVDDDQ